MNELRNPLVARLYVTGLILTLVLPFVLAICCVPFISVGLLLVLFVKASIFEAAFFLFLVPFFVMIGTSRWRKAVTFEKRMRDTYGVRRFLWFDEEPGYVGRTLRPVVLGGWDLLYPTIVEQIKGVLGGHFDNIVDTLPLSTEELASVTWGWVIDTLDLLTLGPNISFVAINVALYYRVWWLHRASFRLALRVLKFAAAACVLTWALEDDFVIRVIAFIVTSLKLFKAGVLGEWFRWRITHLVVCMAVLALDVQTIGRKYTPVAWAQLSGSRKNTSVVGFFKEKMMQATVFISDLGLPHYIRGTRPPSKKNLQESLDLLKDLGWPVNVELTDHVDPVTVRQGFQEWLVCGTDWQQGIKNLKLWTDELLDDLRKDAVEFKRTEEYANVDNELQATSRYFKSPRYDYPDLDLDDVWFMVKDTFQHSRLTPFNHIIWMWEKKYGLGAFFRKPGSKAKLSRRAFISSIGGLKPFKNLWRKTFEFSTQIVPVSAVFVKGEALPPKKWMEDKVRTVIGSPIVHYIMSTIWNYEPNHRFAWVSTPTKIGMPLNGYWMADLYYRHSRCQHHVAGDMSAFDSTISGKVQELVRAVRKKGFEEHKDHARICELIDIAYDQLQSQYLNHTSTGQIYRKGTGLTTGHSSTSADNSLSLCILYMLAWKELTGLGAKEFVHFNELSDYGDDHILSYLATKPAAWNFRNIQKVMKRWGVTNRCEAEGSLDKIPFLSKYSRKLTNEDKLVFRKAGVPLPKRVVFHDKDRLVGKMTAKVKNFDPKYRATRLLSYLSLTAHHPDVYGGIKRVLTRSSTMKRAMKAMGKTVPSYEKILQDWYNPSTHSVSDKFDEMSTEAHDNGLVFSYGQVSWLDTFLSSVSLLPDFVNPNIFNFGYDRMLQLAMRPWLSWPVTLMVSQNLINGSAELRSCLGKSAYQAIIPDIFEGSSIDTEPHLLLMRHWLFCWYFLATRKWVRTPWIAGITQKSAQLQFLINCTVTPDFAVMNWKVLDVLVIALLNLVPLSPWAKPLASVQLPRLDIIFNTFMGSIIGLFWTSVPPNYKEVTDLARRLPSLDGPLLVTAGTGTGKSTSLIKHLSLIVGSKYNKVVVIEPRSVIVKSLVPYVRDTLLVDATGRTSGMDFDGTRKVWYVTAQEAILHAREILDPGNLVILDEAHITEPAYLLLNHVLHSRADIDSMMFTATPSLTNVESCAAEVHLNVAKIWSVSAESSVSQESTPLKYLASYRNKVLDVVNNMPRLCKALVFYPDKAGGVALGNQINRRVSYLNSEQTDTSGEVIICTNVADAGITIPSVDLVISGTIDYIQGKFGGRPTLVTLPQLVLDQRKGRTGRTNNGRFVLFAGPRLSLDKASSVSLDPTVIVPGLLSNGIGLELVKGLDDKLFQDFGRAMRHEWGTTDKTTEESLGLFMKLWKNMEDWRVGRTLIELGELSPEGPEVIFDYTAAGNVSTSSILSTNETIEAGLTLASQLTKLRNNMEVDDVEFDRVLKTLTQITATKAPLTGVLPFEVAETLVDGYTKQEHDFDVKNFERIQA